MRGVTQRSEQPKMLDPHGSLKENYSSQLKADLIFFLARDQEDSGRFGEAPFIGRAPSTVEGQICI